MSSELEGNGTLAQKAADLEFLDNIDELNTSWPDYQVQQAHNPFSEHVSALRALTQPWDTLQDFQNSADDVFSAQILEPQTVSSFGVGRSELPPVPGNTPPPDKLWRWGLGCCRDATGA